MARRANKEKGHLSLANANLAEDVFVDDVSNGMIDRLCEIKLQKLDRFLVHQTTTYAFALARASRLALFSNVQNSRLPFGQRRLPSTNPLSAKPLCGHNLATELNWRC